MKLTQNMSYCTILYVSLELTQNVHNVISSVPVSHILSTNEDMQYITQNVHNGKFSNVNNESIVTNVRN